MLGIRWWHHVTHNELQHKANITSLEYILYQRQLRWVGHVIRLSSDWMLLQLLYGEQEQRTVGHPKKNIMQTI